MSYEKPLDRSEPKDTDAFFEFQNLTPLERDYFYGCRAVLLEDGMEAMRAERDAVAAVLQHRRLTAPSSTEYLDWLKRGARFDEDTGPPPKTKRGRKPGTSP